MAEYQANVDPVDRAIADAAHADNLHNAGPFPPVTGRARPRIPGATPPPVFTAPEQPGEYQVGYSWKRTAGAGTLPIPATSDPVEVPDAVQWFGEVLAAAQGSTATSPMVPMNAPHADERGWAVGNLDEPRAGDFNVEATLIAAAVRCCTPQADGAHEPYCPVYGYPPPVTRDANPVTSDRGAPPGMAELFDAAERADRADRAAESLAPWPSRFAGESGVSWEDLASFALVADPRVVMAPDGSLYCRTAYENVGGDQCRDWHTARLDSLMPTAEPIRELLIWLAKHWGCGQ